MNLLLIVLTFVSCGFLVIPGMYSIFLGKDNIENAEKVNIIGESLEILVGAVKGKVKISIYGHT